MSEKIEMETSELKPQKYKKALSFTFYRTLSSIKIVENRVKVLVKAHKRFISSQNFVSIFKVKRMGKTIEHCTKTLKSYENIENIENIERRTENIEVRIGNIKFKFWLRKSFRSTFTNISHFPTNVNLIANVNMWVSTVLPSLSETNKKIENALKYRDPTRNHPHHKRFMKHYVK